AFVLGRDVTGESLASRGLAAHVDAFAAAAEIVDSAIAGWDIDIVDTIADNASSGAFALGSLKPFDASFDLAAAPMRLLCDGEQRSSGVGAASLGNPLT